MVYLFNLTIEEGFTEEVGLKLDELLEKYDVSYIFEERVENEYGYADARKWYDREKDMRKISEELGEDILLLLEVEKEWGNDMWREYYKNGKSATYYPKIVWKEYSENDLR